MIVAILLIAAPVVAFAGVSGPSPIPAPPNFFISSPMLSLCRGQVNYIAASIFDSGVSAQSTGSNSSALVSQPNLHGVEMQDVQLSASGGKGIYAIGNSTINVGNIAPNTVATAYLPLFISANASSILPVSLSIYYYYYELYSDTETRNLTFSVETCPSPLSVALSPNTLSTGDIENVNVTLANSGNLTLNQITLKVAIPSESGTVLTTQPTEISNISSGASHTVQESIYVYQNVSKSVPFNVTATFYNGTRLQQLEEEIQLLTSGTINLTESELTVSPTIVTPGSIFSISFVLTNTGTESASTSSAEAFPPKGISNFASNSVFIGSIASDSQTPVTLTLESNATLKSGTHIVPITVSYINGLGQSLSTEFNVSVISAGASASAASGEVAARSGGSSGIYSITLLVVIIICVAAYLLYRKNKTKKIKMPAFLQKALRRVKQ